MGIARRLAAEGASMLVAEYNEASCKATAEELRRNLGVRAEVLQVDVCDKTQGLAMVAEAVRVFGSVDVLVNNAWASRRGSAHFMLEETKTDEDLDHAFRIGYMAAFWAIQAAFPCMKEKRWGASSTSHPSMESTPIPTRWTTTRPRKSCGP